MSLFPEPVTFCDLSAKLLTYFSRMQLVMVYDDDNHYHVNDDHYHVNNKEKKLRWFVLENHQPKGKWGWSKVGFCKYEFDACSFGEFI